MQENKDEKFNKKKTNQNDEKFNGPVWNILF